MTYFKLNFHPQREWPQEFPPFVWQGLQLTNWSQDTGHVELKGEWAEIFFQLYPQLTFCELADLFQLIQKNKLTDSYPINLKNLFSKYNYFYNAELVADMNLIIRLPESFKKWATEKKLQPGDLLPLRAVQDLTSINLWLIQWNSLSVSRSDGTQLLELLCDLSLQGKLNLKVPEKYSTELMRELKKLRYPEATKRETDLNQALSLLPWTKEINTKTERRGDTLGVEIKFFIRNAQDLKNKIDSQSRVLESWRS